MHHALQPQPTAFSRQGQRLPDGPVEGVLRSAVVDPAAEPGKLRTAVAEGEAVGPILQRPAG